jgi:hypothetical protein
VRWIGGGANSQLVGADVALLCIRTSQESKNSLFMWHSHNIHQPTKTKAALLLRPLSLAWRNRGSGGTVHDSVLGTRGRHGATWVAASLARWLPACGKWGVLGHLSVTCMALRVIVIVFHDMESRPRNQ